MVWCPFPTEEEARRVANTLLDERLIACANIIPGMLSIYEWQGERGEAREVGVLFKTSTSASREMTARLAQLHSYETPAIMKWVVAALPQSTAQWIEGQASGE